MQVVVEYVQFDFVGGGYVDVDLYLWFLFFECVESVGDVYLWQGYQVVDDVDVEFVVQVLVQVVDFGVEFFQCCQQGLGCVIDFVVFVGQGEVGVVVLVQVYVQVFFQVVYVQVDC